MDKNEKSILILAGICLLIAVGLIGSILTYNIIQKDCELLNVFRINDDVYSCMREYHSNDYT
jgi:hypothetical protein